MVFRYLKFKILVLVLPFILQKDGYSTEVITNAQILLSTFARAH